MLSRTIPATPDDEKDRGEECVGVAVVVIGRSPCRVFLYYTLTIAMSRVLILHTYDRHVACSYTTHLRLPCRMFIVILSGSVVRPQDDNSDHNPLISSRSHLFIYLSIPVSRPT